MTVVQGLLLALAIAVFIYLGVAMFRSSASTSSRAQRC
ncbi:MAG: potassium-transporting ATPase subunit F [Acidimicrobiales bacterium]